MPVVPATRPEDRDRETQKIKRQPHGKNVRLADHETAEWHALDITNAP